MCLTMIDKKFMLNFRLTVSSREGPEKIEAKASVKRVLE